LVGGRRIDRQNKSGGEEYKGRYLFYSHASFTPDRRAFEIARVRL